MPKRYNVVVAREVDGKTFWTKVGVAFPMRGNKGISVKLDALPMGECCLFPVATDNNRMRDEDVEVPVDVDDDLPF